MARFVWTAKYVHFPDVRSANKRSDCPNRDSQDFKLPVLKNHGAVRAIKKRFSLKQPTFTFHALHSASAATAGVFFNINLS